MRIAVVSRSYADGQDFIAQRYKEQIASFELAKGRIVLKDGTEIVNCYGDPNNFKSQTFDAYVVTPNYESLETVIRFRAGWIRA